MPLLNRETFKTVTVDNVGSEARDFCAIERTYLSQIRFGLLLGLLSSALLLNARLPDPSGSHEHKVPTYALPLASLYFAASLVCLAAAIQNYNRLWKGLKNGAAFVQSSRYATT
ncbi:hypothetical protein PIIN_00791 [Serendipita indica DSM 11827]|uniref:DUF202 domain-containing protein n=1 Tax=Serendipita indica (strain DSM 11827) TaxID=1109443 RepID=G4T6G6_SERID|nr:hypothetical protein PIIN_00791 [Serendipita indica DSM 11827]